MAVVAVYSVKGGVGKTTLAVSLAWSAATTSGRRTLLWDLDPQGGSGYLLGVEPGTRAQAAGVLARDVDPAKAICSTGIDRLDLLPADDSLRGIDSLFQRLGKRRRLAKLLEGLSSTYERIVLDCAPGLDETSAQILRAADLVVVPLPPSPLARRSLAGRSKRFATSCRAITSDTHRCCRCCRWSMRAGVSTARRARSSRTGR